MRTQLIKSSAIKDVVQSDVVKSRLKEIMGERAPQFAAALVQLVNQSFQLQKCDPHSVIGAALTAASLDLSIDPNIGEAHVVPYGDKAQFQIGYKGFIQLAMRSGEYKSFGSTVVREGELIAYDELTGELVIDKSKKASDKVIGYAAKFRLLNGFERGEYWTVEEVESHAAAYSKSYRYSKGDAKKEQTCLWITKRDEMAIKTVEKSLLSHYGPKSIQMKKAIKMDGGAVIDAESEKVAYIDSPSEAAAVAEPHFEQSVEEPKEVKAEPKTARPATPKPSAEAPKAEPKADGSYNYLKAVKGFMAAAGVTDAQVISFLGDIIDGKPASLEEVNKANPDIIKMIHDGHEDILSRIKGQS